MSFDPPRASTCPPLGSAPGYSVVWGLDVPFGTTNILLTTDACLWYISELDAVMPVNAGASLTVCSYPHSATACQTNRPCDWFAWDGATNSCHLRRLSQGYPYNTTFLISSDTVLQGDLRVGDIPGGNLRDPTGAFTATTCLARCREYNALPHQGPDCFFVNYNPTECWLKSATVAAPRFAVGMPNRQIRSQATSVPVSPATTSAPVPAATVDPNIRSQAPKDSPSPRIPTGAVVGGSVAVLIGILMALAFWKFCQRKGKNDSIMRPQDPNPHLSPPPSAMRMNNPWNNRHVASGSSRDEGFPITSSLPESADFAAASGDRHLPRAATPPPSSWNNQHLASSSYHDESLLVTSPSEESEATSASAARRHPTTASPPAYEAINPTSAPASASDTPLSNYYATRNQVPATSAELAMMVGDALLVQSWLGDDHCVAVNVTRGGIGVVALSALQPGVYTNAKC
ncbi:hypothetical protein DFJ77DRAFT_481313, partial [Powellomyces hirtus]